MKNYFITFASCITIISFLLISGCSSTSGIEKKTDLNIGNLNIGNYVNLSSSKGEKIVVGVDYFEPLNSSIYEKNWNRIQFQIKNVGNKTIAGHVVRYWITDWEGRNYGEISEGSIVGGSEPVLKDHTQYQTIGYNDFPIVPGDGRIYSDIFYFSDKSLEGKLTFYYQFENEMASWIIKPE